MLNTFRTDIFSSDVSRFTNLADRPSGHFIYLLYLWKRSHDLTSPVCPTLYSGVLPTPKYILASSCNIGSTYNKNMSLCNFVSINCTLTDKKENLSFLIYKEILNGAVAKSYMRKGFLIY